MFAPVLAGDITNISVVWDAWPLGCKVECVDKIRVQTCRQQELVQEESEYSIPFGFPFIEAPAVESH